MYLTLVFLVVTGVFDFFWGPFARHLPFGLVFFASPPLLPSDRPVVEKKMTFFFAMVFYSVSGCLFFYRERNLQWNAVVDLYSPGVFIFS